MRRGVGAAIIRAAIAGVACVLLEFCTLAGAYVASPFDLSCWSARRMAVFFALAFLVACFIPSRLLRGEWKSKLSSALRVVQRFLVASWKVFAVALALGVVVTAGSWLVLGHCDVRFGLFAAVLCAAVGLFRCHWQRIREASEWGFLILVVSTGTLMLAFTPAYSSIIWDGFVHYNAMQALSFVENAEYDGVDQAMSTYDAYRWTRDLVPESSEDFALKSLDGNTIRVINEAIDSARQADVVCMEGTNKLGGGTYVGANMIGRLPNALGLWLARLLHVTPRARLVMARAVGLAVYVALFFGAIRRLRWGKLAVSAIGLMPSSLFLATSYSYDPLCIALIAYAFCRYFGLLQETDRTIGARELATICACCALGVLVKAVLFPLLLVFLFVPSDRLENPRIKKVFTATAVSLVAVVVCTFALPFLLNMASRSDLRGGSDVDAVRQVAFMLAHPASFARTLAASIADYLSLGRLANTLCVYEPYLMPEGAPTTTLLSGLFFLALVFCAVVDRERDEGGPVESVPWLKASSWAAFAGCIVLQEVALYIAYTPVAAGAVAGMQMRYLIPLLVPFCVPCLDIRVRSLLSREHLTKATMSVLGALLTLAIAAVYVVRFA